MRRERARHVRLMLLVDVREPLSDQIGDSLGIAGVLYAPHSSGLSGALFRHPLTMDGLPFPSLIFALGRDLFVVAGDLGRRRLGAGDILPGRRTRRCLRLGGAELG